MYALQEYTTWDPEPTDKYYYEERIYGAVYRWIFNVIMYLIIKGLKEYVTIYETMPI